MKRDGEETLREKRKERIPLGIPRKKLDFPSRPGFVRRVIVDRPGRLEDAERAGYQFVTEATLHGDASPKDLTERESVDSRITRVVGTHEDGRPMYGYLMEIPEELYKEDQRTKQAVIDKMEAAMRRGQDDQGGPGQDGRYIPRVGIKIERGSMP
jgi:hypothetical protein